MGRRRYGIAARLTLRRATMLSSSRALCGFTATAGRVRWPNGWNSRAVPLSKIQTDVLRLISEQRDPESYIAGASPLNRDTPRFSRDIDLFNDREERVAQSAEADTAALAAAGYEIRWLRRSPAIFTAEVAKGGASTLLEWVVDSDFRFFPAVKDKMFGFVLHPVDLAINKVMAAAGRREVRDIVDLDLIDAQVLSLGALIWAAVERSPGFTPEGLIAEIRRNLHHSKAEWQSLDASEPIDPEKTIQRLTAALERAEAFVARMPTEKIGLLFLENDKIVQPDPDRLDDYQTHAGHRGGQWPSDPEIQKAMLERYTR
jgi:hypothetical protein